MRKGSQERKGKTFQAEEFKESKMADRGTVYMDWHSGRLTEY
jgi:hypothetical protein